MKHIYIVVLWLMWLAASPLQAQPRFTSHTERISFGQIAWKHPVAAEFSITNTGTEPLVLTQVEPDCACAVAEWTQTPIAAGEKGILRVTFDAEALGKFQKTILVSVRAVRLTSSLLGRVNSLVMWAMSVKVLVNIRLFIPARLMRHMTVFICCLGTLDRFWRMTYGASL